MAAIRTWRVRCEAQGPTVMRTIVKESSDRTTLFKCSSEGEIDVSSDLTTVVKSDIYFSTLNHQERGNPLLHHDFSKLLSLLCGHCIYTHEPRLTDALTQKKRGRNGQHVLVRHSIAKDWCWGQKLMKKLSHPYPRVQPITVSAKVRWCLIPS